MKFGILFANTLQFSQLDGLIELGQVAEKSGFESLWTVEHTIYPSHYESEYPYDPSGKMAAKPSTPMPDPLIWLSFVAAHTTTLRLGTGILILPQRNPLTVAKMVGTLDSLSGGRMELGIGVGWLEEEFNALGVEFSRRGKRTNECIDVIRNLWSGDDVSYSGDFYNYQGVSSNPKPTAGTVPIHVGGHSAAAAKRAGRIGDGFFPGAGKRHELVDIMKQTASDAGRDPQAIEVTAFSPAIIGNDPLGAVEELTSEGVSRVGIPAFMYMDNPNEQLGAFGENVISKV